jgi:hypothetical protein
MDNLIKVIEKQISILSTSVPPSAPAPAPATTPTPTPKPAPKLAPDTSIDYKLIAIIGSIALFILLGILAFLFRN